MTIGRALHGVDLLIGIDDTDDPTSPGTGRRCRQLIAELEEAELGSAGGRHPSSAPGRPAYPLHVPQLQRVHRMAQPGR
ncbi:hypothetical protein GCM10010464_61830 [Pseudonocardia yunnanensis]|uniref:Transposase IS701-like DDE domain-containing protein n=1 Tax=Pseudonocardia yunnanensis TaxID=58107 RepID=A0ABW4EPV4_9PSEU